jgi:nucleotide-binding universal stress UspA family protein
VHAVHVREAKCQRLASYAVHTYIGAVNTADDDEIDDVDAMWRSVLLDLGPAGQDDRDVQVRTEVAEGLPARVLLDRCAGADMLVLGTASDVPGSARSAGPVIRALLRRAPCPVVVISAAKDDLAAPAAWNARTGTPPEHAPVAVRPQVVPVGV